MHKFDIRKVLKIVILSMTLIFVASSLVDVFRDTASAKYEFVDQSGEVREGYNCYVFFGQRGCRGYDGTKYFDVQSYKLINE